MRHHKGIGREVVTKKESSGPETISNRTIAKLLKLKLNRNRASPNYVHFMLKRLNHQNPCMKASFARIHAPSEQPCRRDGPEAVLGVHTHRTVERCVARRRIIDAETI